MRLFCVDCGSEKAFDPVQWRCECGGAWEPTGLPEFNPEKIDYSNTTMWRYGKMLGLDVHSEVKKLSIGWTPLIPIDLFGHQTYLKLDYLSPSGSFKDRGINAMVNQLYQMGFRNLIEDSSGNAGASLAMHGARFDMNTEIYFPEQAAPAKINQIAIYGAQIKPIPGPREAAEQAAQANVTTDRIYASHAYNPAYLAGQISGSYELWEQLGRRAPDWIICPVGQGGLFLGYWFGFTNLLQSNLIVQMPRLVAVQSKTVSPVYNAWINKLDRIPEVFPEGKSLADGVAITKPIREKRILQALEESNGLALSISEDDIWKAQQLIACKGFYIEPTSALVVAGFNQITQLIREGETVVLPLTGSGLKTVLKKQ